MSNIYYFLHYLAYIIGLLTIKISTTKLSYVAAPRCEISNQILKELIDLKDMFKNI